MRTLDLAMYLGLPLMIGGLICWNVGAEIAKAWLRKNDPSYEAPSALAKMFIGGLFTSIGPVRSYARQRQALNQPAGAATAFWLGIATSLGGLAVFLLLILAST